MIRLAKLLLVPLVVISSGAMADDQDVIDYRRSVMKTMGEQAQIIGMVLEGRAPPTAVATYAKVLAITAGTAKFAFEPNVPGGKAKDKVWSDWPDFSKRLDELVATTNDLAKVTQSGGVEALRAKIKTLPCKSCHDVYREPTKS